MVFTITGISEEENLTVSHRNKTYIILEVLKCGAETLEYVGKIALKFDIELFRSGFLPFQSSASREYPS